MYFSTEIKTSFFQNKFRLLIYLDKIASPLVFFFRAFYLSAWLKGFLLQIVSSLETPPPNRFSDFRVHYYLLKSKNVLIEIVLDLLIGDIYAELLKRISLKVLESKNIQDSHIHTIVCTTAQERTKSFREGNIYLRTVRIYVPLYLLPRVPARGKQHPATSKGETVCVLNHFL